MLDSIYHNDTNIILKLNFHFKNINSLSYMYLHNIVMEFI